MEEQKPKEKINLWKPKKKKINFWKIGYWILVIAVCIALWEGGKYHFNEWKQEVYDTGYNQSRTDTIFLIANSGSYPVYTRDGNETVLTFATLNQICGVE